MFIKPRDGIKVRDPVTMAILPAEGKDVGDHDIYWHRRLRDGDVIVSESTTSAAPAAPAKE